jgi:hypothetical protein
MKPAAPPERMLGVDLISAATIDGPTCAESLFPHPGAVSKVDVAAGAPRRFDLEDSDLPILAFAPNEADVGVLLESLTRAHRPL